MIARRFATPRSLAVLAGLYLGALALPGAANASVVGRNGVEIEGAQDRRGFFVGAGIGFGATFFDSPLFARTYRDQNKFIPAGRLELALGGGVTKRFTLGANLYLGTYASPKFGPKILFGGDIDTEIRIELIEGTYLNVFERPCLLKHPFIRMRMLRIGMRINYQNHEYACLLLFL